MNAEEKTHRSEGLGEVQFCRESDHHVCFGKMSNSLRAHYIDRSPDELGRLVCSGTITPITPLGQLIMSQLPHLLQMICMTIFSPHHINLIVGFSPGIYL